MHNHILKYRKHNGIIILTLFLNLQVKIQYGCRYKANIIYGIECEAISLSVRVGSRATPYNYIP